ncbi:type III secretion system export apparatus subunit SctU [Sansalvadorimonas verongulae]|uniref:type III secretion system export apparatus subunit SctU n=1 Tax=Sansalvadorimonas verongulae TaxID=2172824 RepID=UPI0012BB750F|nr:type III secretion system export apparatus subunit SctU [Sansalvadorimonas verongulae]MTI14263.1 EscU/YscU/HrcU family type III secretion system export apparatus switch protein [Sansalvadorimonas verongulae]
MSGEKTEQPTPKKLRDARKKGQVAKSKEISSTAGIIAVVAIIWALSDWYVQMFQELLLYPAEFYEMEFRDALKSITLGLLSKALLMIAPLVVASAFAAVAGNVVQFGILLAFEPIKPDIKKINPIQGAKKIFSIKNVVELVKSIIKILFLSLVVYFVIKGSLSELMNLPYCGTNCILPVLGSLMKKLMLFAIVAFMVISVLDFMFEKYQFTKEQKMTKDEVKREYKEMEGNPEIKGKRKELHRELLNSEDNVAQSDVVIKNPTHIAVGLHYNKAKTPLPMVTCLGKRNQAQFIIKAAERHGIPVMENVPLAHALFSQTEVFDYIPSELISPVAEVFRWVQQMKQDEDPE